MSEFKLFEKIGEGGMGVVYRAQQNPLKREVAIKYLLAGAADDPKAVQRFRREMETLSQLSHGNIIRIYDAGEQDGKLFIAMEYLKGTLSLEQVIAKEGPMPLDRVVPLIVPLLDALDLVHSKGLLHRDIKPSNILIEADGRPILMDFGLVKVSDKTALTKTGFLVGTPKFMPPEKICGLDEGVASDLWSMGMVLYQMLTGEPAFHSPSLPELCKKIMDEPHPPASRMRPGLPLAVDAIIDRFLEKDPAKRISSAKEGMELLQALTEEGVELELPSQEPITPPLVLPSAAKASGVLLLVLLGLLGIGWMVRRGSEPVTPARAPTELTWGEEADRVTVRFTPSEDGAHRLDALEKARVARSVTSVTQSARSTDLVIEGLTAGKSYRLVLTSPGGKMIAEREVSTPSLDAVARELSIAMERFDPHKVLVNLTNRHYELWNAEQARKVKDPALERFPQEWEAKLRELREKHHIAPRAAAYSRRIEEILGSPEVGAQHKRVIRDLSFDFREIEETCDLVGMSYEPVSALVDSPHYGMIRQPRIQKKKGWVFPFEDPARIPREYPEWEAYVQGLELVDDGFRERMRAVNDPRESSDLSIEGLLHSLYVSAKTIEMPPAGRLGRVEIHAFLKGAPANMGLDVWVGPRRLPSRRAWKRIAQLRPVDDTPQLLYHSLPPDILGSEPFHVMAELAYCRNWHLLGEGLDQRLDVVFLALQYEER